VLIKEDDITKPRSQVIDGQQRLVTLTILLSVIRDLCNEDIAANLIDFIVQKGKPLLKIPDQYRLTLREEDEKFFRDYIQTYGKIEQLVNSDSKICKTDSQKNIKCNAALFFKDLKDMSKLEIEQLALYLLSQCYLVVVSTPDSDSAYRIFAILNDRGLDLSHADILKSEIIGKIPNNQKKDYAKLWNDAEDKLGREAFAALFSHIRMIKHPEKLRNDILKEFREFVIDPIIDPMKVIQEIMEYATVYDDIKNEKYESSSGAEKINITLGWLNKIDNKDWLPPAILYLSLHKADPHELNRFFVDLERLAAGLMIRRANVNERIRRYGHVLNAIKNGSDLYETSSHLQLTPWERLEIIHKLQEDDFYKSKFALYVLLRLNDAILEDGIIFKFSSVTIEHVLPQSLPKEGKWKEWFSESDHIKYVNKLGNLILLTGLKNKGNDEFEVKRKRYLERKKYGITSFPLSLEAIKDATEWTKDVIDHRQEEQIEILKGIWRL